MDKVCICWRSLDTGATGRGEPIIRFLAAAWMEHLAPLRPRMVYWLEDATPSNSTGLEGK